VRASAAMKRITYHLSLITQFEHQPRSLAIVTPPSATIIWPVT
jgi:hypothetical protein